MKVSVEKIYKDEHGNELKFVLQVIRIGSL